MKAWNKLSSDVIIVGQELIINGALSGGRPGKKSTYVVKTGDTLFKIAIKHGVEVAELKDWNQLSSDVIKVGQRLEIYK